MSWPIGPGFTSGGIEEIAHRPPLLVLADLVLADLVLADLVLADLVLADLDLARSVP